MAPMLSHRSRRDVSFAIGLLSASALACLSPRDEGTTLNPPAGMIPAGGTPGTGTTPRPSTDGPAGDPYAPAQPLDAGGAGLVCPAGFHECTGRCADNLSPENCGLSCERCPQIIDGEATCDGTRCAVRCPDGKKPCLDRCIPMEEACGGGDCPAGKNPCGGICVDATSLSACGSACATCPFSPNGKSTCDGDKCLLTCNPGYHRCGDGCAPDTEPGTCGTSCSACPEPTGGEATCQAGRCGARCPDDRKLCLGACIPINTACDGVCPPGKRDCSGNCVNVEDTNYCGPSCEACKPVDHADVRCASEACAYTCRSGYHKCDDECRDDGSVDSCGDRCTTCPEAPAGGKTVCRSGKCDFDCPGGRRCGNSCIGNDVPCNGMCPAGLRACGNRCVPAAAGTCCEDKECGACNSCQGFRCQATASGQNGPGCAGNCRECQGGRCQDKAGTCGPRTCGAGGNIFEGRCSGGECRPQMVEPCAGKCRSCQDGVCRDSTGNCSPRRCESGAVVEGRCSGGECREEREPACRFVCTGAACTGSCVPGSVCPGTGTCQNDREIPETRCDANGRCSTPGGTPCRDGLRCGGTRCLDSCSSDSNCVSGRVCVNGACRQQQNEGGPCSQNNECRAPAEFCVDGRCSHCRISCGPQISVVVCDKKTRECRLTSGQLCNRDQECVSNSCPKQKICTTADNDTADCSQSEAACVLNDCQFLPQGFCR